MAINEINNNPNILSNTKLVTSIRSGNGYYESTKASFEFVNSFYDTGVIALINSMPNIETIASTKLLSNRGNILQLITQASDSSLLNSLISQYSVHLNAIESYDGHVLQDILCNYYQYSIISVFNTNDVYGINSFNELTNEEYCRFNILGNYVFSTTTTDFSAYIDNAKVSGAFIFVILTSAEVAAQILTQGNEFGLFTTGTQIFAGSKITTTDIFDYLIDLDVINGMIGVQYDPVGSLTLKKSLLNNKQSLNHINSLTQISTMTQNISGLMFFNKWIQQNYTGPSYQYEKYICNKLLDDSNEQYLYQNFNGSKCIGLNFSSYNIHTKIPNPYALLTYDATYTLAYGLNHLLNNNIAINSHNLNDIILHNISFEGASGSIKFNSIDDSNDRTTRVTGINYKIMNFQLKLQLNHSNQFSTIGLWNSMNKMQTNCNECISPVYNTDSNELPNQSKQSIYIILPKIYSISLLIIAIIVLLMTIFLIIFFILKQKHKLIKASQPIMIGIILIGQLFSAIKILIVALFPITDMTCNLGLWFAHLAFVLVFGSLFVKTYRVDCIVNAGNLT